MRHLAKHKNTVLYKIHQPSQCTHIVQGTQPNYTSSPLYRAISGLSAAQTVCDRE